MRDQLYYNLIYSDRVNNLYDINIDIIKYILKILRYIIKYILLMGYRLIKSNRICPLNKKAQFIKELYELNQVNNRDLATQKNLGVITL